MLLRKDAFDESFGHLLKTTVQVQPLPKLMFSLGTTSVNLSMLFVVVVRTSQ